MRHSPTLFTAVVLLLSMVWGASGFPDSPVSYFWTDCWASNSIGVA